MDEHIIEELYLAGAGFAAGLRLMAVYGGLRILRLFVPHHPFLAGAEDFAYWIFSSFTVFGLLYRGNGGIVRGYVIAATAAGMLLADKLVVRNVLRVLQKWKKSLKMKFNKQKKLVSK